MDIDVTIGDGDMAVTMMVIGDARTLQATKGNAYEFLEQLVLTHLQAIMCFT